MEENSYTLFRQLNSSQIDNYQQIASPRKRKVWIHIGLFVATIFTTYFVGLGDGPVGALWYSFGLIAILLTHEMGHYLMAKKHGVPATLPFFIPVPLPPFGTMGAVIKMEARIPDRKALFDVGVAGPLAGLVMIIPAILLGTSMSRIVTVSSLGEGTISLGDSMLFSMLSRISVGPLPPGHDLLLHPLAFAGWVGLLVTALNLLPVGQLDGGHILYALFWKKSKAVSTLFYLFFLFICLFFYAGWLLLVVVLAIFRKHPPTMNDQVPLDGKRLAVGIGALVILIFSFTPVPFGIGGGLIPMILKSIQF